jgi:hypothetical protein
MVIGLAVSLTRHAFAVLRRGQLEVLHDKDFLRTPIQHIMVQHFTNFELGAIESCVARGLPMNLGQIDLGQNITLTTRKIETAVPAYWFDKPNKWGKFGRINQKFPLCGR